MVEYVGAHDVWFLIGSLLWLADGLPPGLMSLVLATLGAGTGLGDCQLLLWSYLGLVLFCHSACALSSFEDDSHSDWHGYLQLAGEPLGLSSVALKLLISKMALGARLLGTPWEEEGWPPQLSCVGVAGPTPCSWECGMPERLKDGLAHLGHHCCVRLGKTL